MDIEQQANYYAVIPAPVRYNKKLKYPERLLYGEITALSNRYGYCFASNSVTNPKNFERLQSLQKYPAQFQDGDKFRP